MKFVRGFVFLFVFTACNQRHNNIQQLQAYVDSLQYKLDNSYKPGLGELMSSIQMQDFSSAR